MALFNVTTEENTLLAVRHDAHAISELVNQNAEDTDFESAREMRAHWLLSNISTLLSSADTLITSTPIVDGERIFIRLNDGTIVDTIASGVQPDTASLVPRMTSNDSPAGQCVHYDFGSDPRTDPWKVFDGDELTVIQLGNASIAPSGIGYSFENQEPHLVTQYYLRDTSNGTFSWKIEGSVNGVDWSTISTEVSESIFVGKIYTIQSPGEFGHYRVVFSQYSTYNIIASFDLLGTGSSVDTSSVTNGETPDQVFKFEEEVLLNGIKATEKDIYYEFGNWGSKLYALTLYEDLTLDGRVFSTRINFTATGNAMTELTAQIFKEI